MTKSPETPVEAGERAQDEAQEAARARIDHLFRKCGTRACAELRRAVEDFRKDEPA